MSRWNFPQSHIFADTRWFPKSYSDIQDTFSAMVSSRSRPRMHSAVFASRQIALWSSGLASVNGRSAWLHVPRLSTRRQSELVWRMHPSYYNDPDEEIPI